MSNDAFGPIWSCHCLFKKIFIQVPPFQFFIHFELFGGNCWNQKTWFFKFDDFQENITQTFIVLNTNLYYSNKAKTVETDPCGQVSGWFLSSNEIPLSSEKEREIDVKKTCCEILIRWAIFSDSWKKWLSWKVVSSFLLSRFFFISNVSIFYKIERHAKQINLG